MDFTVELKKASYSNTYLKSWTAKTASELVPYNDNGVFVNTGDGYDGETTHPKRGRSTVANGKSRGIINMVGKKIEDDCGISIAIELNSAKLRSGLCMTSPNATSFVFPNSNTPGLFEKGPYKIIGTPRDAEYGSTDAYKLEVMKTGRYAVTGGGTEAYYLIHAMGFTTILRDNDGEIMGYSSWLFAPLVDVGDETGYPNISNNGYPYITNSTIVFDDTGTCFHALPHSSDPPHNLVPGTNVTGVGNNISTAMPDSVFESNTGILAVACMVSGDGHAHWVGYKNGVYKVYQGSKPFYGMPGERMTIKKHEFVCLSYGPFYARLS